MSLISTATTICIAAGCVIALMSLLGCAGILLEQKTLLFVYAAFLVLVLIMEFVVGYIGFQNLGMLEATLDESLKPAILEKYGYPEHTIITMAVNLVQYKMECCGYTGPTDWANSSFYNEVGLLALQRGSSVMPVTCCKDVVEFGCNNAYNNTFTFKGGCKEKIKDILMPNLKVLGITTVATSAFQVLGLVLSISLYCKSKDEVMPFYE